MALAVLALTGYLCFFTATFGRQTLRARRVSAEWGWRRPVSRTDMVGEALCVAGCALTLAAPALALAGVARAIRPPWVAVQALGAAAFLGFGAALAIWAQRHLAEQWRAGVEASAKLVTGGPFAWVRNPFYVGCILASAGVLAAVPSGVALAGLALHIAASVIIVRGVEEPLLLRAHGPAFRRYQQQVGRFLPRRRV